MLRTWTTTSAALALLLWASPAPAPPRVPGVIRAQAPPTIQTLDPQRGGQDLVGTRFPKLDLDRRIEAEPGVPVPENPKATLYRWWTDTCPYCRASLPAVEALRQRYGPQGLDVVAVYHPKPPRDVDDDLVRDTAREIGYQGAIAIDQDWSALQEAYLSSGERRATSVTFLVDDQGVTRFLQPGPVFFPSTDPRYAVENQDYLLLRDAIETLLQE